MSTTTLTTTETNKQVIGRLFAEMWNSANWSMLEDLGAEDMQIHVPFQADPMRGRQGAIDFFRLTRDAFPRGRIGVADLVADGDRVAARTTLEGTHEGVYFDIPATKARVNADEISMYRLVDGRIHEAWFIPNTAGITGQFGMPSGPPPRALLVAMQVVRRLRRPAGGREDGGTTDAAEEDRSDEVATTPQAWSDRTAASREAQENKERVQRGLEEIWNQGDWSVSGELYAPGLTIHAPADPEPLDLEWFHQTHTMLHTALPDFHVTVEDLIAEGDRVAVRWTLSGTQNGPYFGFPPTGKRLTMQTMEIFRFSEGRLRELWVLPDALGALQRLGHVPSGKPPRIVMAALRVRRALRSRRRPSG